MSFRWEQRGVGEERKQLEQRNVSELGYIKNVDGASSVRRTQKRPSAKD